MPNTIAAVSCQPSPRSAASAISTAPPASAAAAPTPWVSALANSSRGSWTMARAAVIGTPCAMRVEQSLAWRLRAAAPCRAFAVEELDVVDVALQRHGIADEHLAAALRRRLRLWQRDRAAIGEFDPRLVVAPGHGDRAGIGACVGHRRAGCRGRRGR